MCTRWGCPLSDKKISVSLIIQPALASEASGGEYCLSSTEFSRVGNKLTRISAFTNQTKHGEEYMARLCQHGNLYNCLTHSLLPCVFMCFKPTPAVAVAAPAATVKFKGLTKTSAMKVKWTQLGLVFFLVLSLVMTGCFFWQYQLPKLLPGENKLYCWQTIDRITFSLVH